MSHPGESSVEVHSVPPSGGSPSAAAVAAGTEAAPASTPGSHSSPSAYYGSAQQQQQQQEEDRMNHQAVGGSPQHALHSSPPAAAGHHNYQQQQPHPHYPNHHQMYQQQDPTGYYATNNNRGHVYPQHNHHGSGGGSNSLSPYPLSHHGQYHPQPQQHHHQYGYGMPPPPPYGGSGPQYHHHPYHHVPHYHHQQPPPSHYLHSQRPPPPHYAPEMYPPSGHHHHPHHPHPQYPYPYPYPPQPAAAAAAAPGSSPVAPSTPMPDAGTAATQSGNDVSSAATTTTGQVGVDGSTTATNTTSTTLSKVTPPSGGDSSVAPAAAPASHDGQDTNININSMMLKTPPRSGIRLGGSGGGSGSRGGVRGTPGTVVGEAYYGEIEADIAAMSSPSPHHGGGGGSHQQPQQHQRYDKTGSTYLENNNSNAEDDHDSYRNVGDHAPATKNNHAGLSSSSPRKRNTNKSKHTASDDGTRLVTLSDLNLDRWFVGCVPLGLDDDKFWLSELHVFLRANLAQIFTATEEDIAAPMHGRNKPVFHGQVGVRCMYCKHLAPTERAQYSNSYPSLISGIYNSVQQMLKLHLECCQSVPPDVVDRIQRLKASSSSRGGRKQYWADSGRRIGLVDTANGIYFGRDPYGPLPPLTGPSVTASKEVRKRKEPTKKPPPPPPPLPPEEEVEEELPTKPIDNRRLVFSEDKSLISDYLYLTMEQMAPCEMTEFDLIGCYKTRTVGEPGLACRHCVGGAGAGRYFPANESSLSQTTTSQTIMNHVLNCNRCPVEIRENIEYMKRSRIGPDGKRVDKPKHGGRKIFFHRLWCRIQGQPIDGEDESNKASRNDKGQKKSPRTVKKSAENNFGFSPITNRKSNQGTKSSRSFDESAKRVAAASRSNPEGQSTNDGDHDDEEEPADNMNALIKAAAIWLTEQDEVGGESGGGGAGRGRGRSKGSTPSPSRPKRSVTSSSPPSGGKSGQNSPSSGSKRRKLGGRK